MTAEVLKLTKLDAARRQLNTAIELWFNDGDPVSIHTLVRAAYEIIHVISKARNPNRRDLVFDSLIVKDEYRADWNKLLKDPGNFFKHAKKEKNIDATLDYKPVMAELFLLFSIMGIELCGEKQNPVESTFMFWVYFNRPEFLTEEGRKQFVDAWKVDDLEWIRGLPKNDFFKVVVEARRARGGPNVGMRLSTVPRL